MAYDPPPNEVPLERLRSEQEYALSLNGEEFVLDFYPVDVPGRTVVGITLIRKSDGRSVDIHLDMDACRVWGG